MLDQKNTEAFVARIEGLIGDIHRTSPSGLETLLEKIRQEIASWRSSGTPAARVRKAPAVSGKKRKR